MSKGPQPDQNVVWNWVVKGLGGTINMLERFEPFFANVRKDQLDELILLHDRLTTMIQQILQSRVK